MQTFQRTCFLQIESFLASWETGGASDVCEINTPPERKAGANTSFQSIKSGAGAQLLLQDCRARAATKGVLFLQTPVGVYFSVSYSQFSCSQSSAFQRKGLKPKNRGLSWPKDALQKSKAPMGLGSIFPGSNCWIRLQLSRGYAKASLAFNRLAWQFYFSPGAGCTELWARRQEGSDIPTRYVCVYICIYIYIYTHYVYTCVYIYIYIHTQCVIFVFNFNTTNDSNTYNYHSMVLWLATLSEAMAYSRPLSVSR